MSGPVRYAAYWAPEPQHPLWQAGCDWLGRDAPTGRTLPTQRAHTTEPRRYGFHATLKAPMALLDGASREDLLNAMTRVAARHTAFAMPPLEVTTLRGFIALRPSVAIHATHPLRRLADACVRELDALRQPPTPQELDRRLASMDFDAAERANIAQVGYAFAFEQWRFHMTLSDSFGSDEASLRRREQVIDEARAHFESALAEPLDCRSLSLFVEPAPGEPFVLQARIPLASA